MKNKNTRIISTIYPQYFRYHRIRLVNTYDVRPQSYDIRRMYQPFAQYSYVVSY